MKDKTIKGLRTCIYKVSDMNEAKKWYSRAFKCEPYFEESYYIGYNVGGYELGLQPEDLTDKEKGESVIAYWGVDNVEKKLNRLRELGAIDHEKPMNVGGDVWVASVEDPWGNIIGLIYNPEFKAE